MDRFESMAVFIAVIENGSLSAGARKLGVPIATVSRKISELETHLGVRLVNRSTRRFELTDTGRAYLESCKRILEDIGEAERAATGEYSAPRGDLVITAPIVFGRLHILPLVAEFLKSYPEINIRLVLADRLINLMEEHVDLAVRIGELPDSSMIGAKVGFIRRITCASPAYLAARGTPKKPKDLSTHDCFTIESIASPNSWTFFDGKLRVSVAIQSRLIVTTAEAGVDAAVAGVGITRALSYQAAQAIKSGQLKILLENFEPPAWPVHLVHPGSRALPLKLRAFLDFAVPKIKGRIPQAASDSLSRG